MKRTIGFVCGITLFATLMYGAIAYQLAATVFDDRFAYAEIDRVDPARVVKSVVLERLDPAAGRFLTPIIDNMLAEQRSWLLSHVRAGASSVLGFLRGDRSRIVIAIEPEPLRADFMRAVEAALASSVPPEVSLLPVEQQAIFTEATRRGAAETFNQIKPFRFDSDALPTGGQQAKTLYGLRQTLSRFRGSLYVVGAVAAVMVVVGAAVGQLWQIALAPLLAGILLFVAQQAGPDVLARRPIPGTGEMPSVVLASIPSVAEHIMAPYGPVSLMFIAAGLVLLAISVVAPWGSDRRAWSSDSRPGSRRR